MKEIYSYHDPIPFLKWYISKMKYSYSTAGEHWNINKTMVFKILHKEKKYSYDKALSIACSIPFTIKERKYFLLLSSMYIAGMPTRLRKQILYKFRKGKSW